MTVLRSGISAHTTVVTVDAPLSNPSYPLFYDLDSETIKIVDGADTTEWQVERGVADTQQARHAKNVLLVANANPYGGGGGGVSVEVPPAAPVAVTNISVAGASISGGTATFAGIYVADDDPGAVGARNLWLQTDPDDNFNTLQLWVRNEADDGWFQAATGSSYGATNGDIGLWDAVSGGQFSGLQYNQVSAYLHAQTDPGSAAARRRIGVSASGGVFLQTGNNFAYLLNGTVSPSAGAGVASDVPALYIRDNSGVTELWLKTGAGDTAWSKVTTS